MQRDICNTLRGFSACSEMGTAAYSPLPLGMRLHDSARSKGLRSSLALLSHSSPQTPHLSCSGGLEEPRWARLHGTYHTAWVTPYSVSCLPLKKRNCHITWNPCFVNRKVRKYLFHLFNCILRAYSCSPGAVLYPTSTWTRGGPWPQRVYRLFSILQLMNMESFTLEVTLEVFSSPDSTLHSCGNSPATTREPYSAYPELCQSKTSLVIIAFP